MRLRIQQCARTVHRRRRTPRSDDVAIDILHGGVQHSGIHQVRDERGGGSYFRLVSGCGLVDRAAAPGAGMAKRKVGNVYERRRRDEAEDGLVIDCFTNGRAT